MSFDDPGDISLHEYVLGALPADDRKAVIDHTRGGRIWTRAELIRATRGLASHLRGAGIADGDTVAVLLENSAEFVIAYHGVLAAGGVVLPLDPRDVPSRWAIAITECRATALIVETAVGHPDFAERQPPVPAERTVCLGASVPVGCVAWQDAVATAPASLSAAGGDSVAVLLSSSGTLGTPKRIALTHRNLVANLAQIAAVHRLHDSDAVQAVSPLRHIYGMQMAMNPALRAGAPLVIGSTPFSVPVFLRQVTEQEVTVVYAVPTVLAELAAEETIPALHGLRLIVSGGAPLPTTVAQRCSEKLGVPVVQGFGMSEAGCICMSPDGVAVPAGSIGVVVPGTDVRFVDPSTCVDVEPGEAGELWVRGPQIITAVPDSPVARAEGGWLRTGDLATRDADGNVWITGRIKSMIKFKGHQVSPAALEEVLATHPAVVEAYVAGVPDPVAGELPKAYVVLSDNTPLSEITAHVAAGVAPHQRVRLIERVQAIPRSATGKRARPPGVRVLLTGGGRGFGRECAEQLAAEGGSVVITGRDEQALIETVKSIRDAGGTAEYVVGDVLDGNAVAHAVHRAVDAVGGIDVLVNNAGVAGPIGPLWTVDEREWWHALEVNLRGTGAFIREVLPGMVDRGAGRIVNVVSRAGQTRWPFVSAYAVSKASLISLTANLQSELRKTGVTAVAFDPGKLEIGITKAHFDRGHTGNPWENKVHDWMLEARDNGEFTAVDAARRTLAAVVTGAADHLSGKYVTVGDLALR